MSVDISWQYEEQYWQQGITFIAGVDEVGLGALAGPVVAAAVVFEESRNKNWESEIPVTIRDSKMLSAQQREYATAWIQQHSFAWAVGEASVEEIDQLNVRAASHLAMQRAVDSLRLSAELLLIDGNPANPHPTIPAVNIVKGDQLVFSIAAASIIAKVHRDQLMVNLDQQFPQYGFAGHKGYAAATHLQSLRKYGPCACHRRSYAPVKAALKTHP